MVGNCGFGAFVALRGSVMQEIMATAKDKD